MTASTSPRTRRGALRALTPSAAALALVCFLLPFATIGCDEPQTFTGMELVRGETGAEAGDPDDDTRAGVPPARVAVAFTLVTLAAALVPGVAAATVAFLGAAFALGALAALALVAYLRPEGILVDLRYGFWAATAALAVAAYTARLRAKTHPPPKRAGDLHTPLLAAGGALLVAAALVPRALADDAPSLTTGVPVPFALLPGPAESFGLGAVPALATPFLVLAAAHVAGRLRAPAVAAGVAVGVAMGAVLGGATGIIHAVAADDTAFREGDVLLLAGAMLATLALTRGLGAGYRERTPVPPAVAAVALVGSAAVVLATFVPYADLAGGTDELPLEPGSHTLVDGGAWQAVAPIGLALAAGTAVFTARRAAPGVLLGLGMAQALVFVPLLFPLLTDGVGLHAGAVFGLVGGALVAGAGAMAARHRAATDGRLAAPESP